MKTWVCLVRHGETAWNAQGRIQGREDTPLNEYGYKQAASAGEYLKREEWDVLVASPLARAKNTAITIGQAIGLDLDREIHALMERDYGVASGMTGTEIEQKFPDGNIPGLEPRAGLNQRVMGAMQEIVESYPGKRIVAVAHGGVINAILAVVSNGAIGSGKTRLANACISLLVHGQKEGMQSEEWAVEYYNYQGHLPDDPDHPLSAHVTVGAG